MQKRGLVPWIFVLQTRQSVPRKTNQLMLTEAQYPPSWEQQAIRQQQLYGLCAACGVYNGLAVDSSTPCGPCKVCVHALVHRWAVPIRIMNLFIVTIEPIYIHSHHSYPVNGCALDPCGRRIAGSSDHSYNDYQRAGPFL